jgi:hypothetical protein
MHPYDVDFHPAEWCTITTIKEDVNISEKHYNYYLNLFGNKKFVDMKRRYHTINGNMYQTSWDGSEEKRESYCSTHSYENRIKASDIRQFHMTPITDSSAKKIGLFKYPELKDHFNYPTLLGLKVNQNIQNEFQKLNAKFGPLNKLRLWVLVFKNPNPQTGYYQENYWVRGNKNELTLCIGIDENKNIIWSNVFSWSPSLQLKNDISNYCNTLQNVNDTSLIKLKNYLNSNLNRFEKKSFKEFKRLTVEPPVWGIILIYILSLLTSFFVNFWNISNEWDDDGIIKKIINKFKRKTY